MIMISKNQLDDLEKRIDKLEIASHFYEKLIERVANLEKHHNYQIDENRKISRRVDEIEENLHWIKNNVGKLSEDVENKRPYKCPVCNGETYVKKQVPAKFTINNEPFVLSECCKACKGEGIVWS